MSAVIDIDTGIYPAMPSDDYFAAPGINSSLLKLAAVAPAKYAHALQAGSPDSPALRFGRLTHTAVLEPESFTDEYVICESSTRTTKAFKEAAKANPAKTVVLEKEVDLALAIANAVQRSPQVREHEHFGDLLAPEYGREVTGFWREGRQLAKFRADAWRLEHCMWDLKTCASAAPDDFLRDAMRYGYPASAAWYMRGAAALMERPQTFLWVAVEKEPPHIVQVYEATVDLIDYGWRVCHRGLDNLQRATETHYWSGYADQTLALDLPAWARPDSATGNVTEEMMA